MGGLDNRTKKSGRQAKITPKRTTLLQKLAYIARPFVLYMLVKTAAMLVLAIAVPSLPIAGMGAWVENHAHQLSAVVNGVASLIAVCFLLNDFLIETSTDGEIDIDKSVPGQFMDFMKTEFLGKVTAHRMTGLALCVLLGVAASLALNIWFKLLAEMLSGAGNPVLDSEKYETVEVIQYSVPIGLGLVLYGIISPAVEEMVFRGVIYSRVKKFYSAAKAVVFSALLFGVFHANLPQFLYGTAMGVLLALCYEYSGCFAAPVLMHMSANIFVFLMSQTAAWTAVLTTPVWGVVAAALSVAVFWAIRECNVKF
ncbi:MAG: CPBP family intramembrane metalloprotease [Lachnospiraceae bacterium]|nr:CPBP family intramembrane metalloprotease [Lachnospiraceae bacterium]